MYNSSIIKLATATYMTNHKLSANGPIDWDGLSDLFNSDSGDFTNNRDIINPPIVKNKDHASDKKKVLKSSIPLSSNQESASFRTVGPNEDTTTTYSGKKMEDIIDTHRNRKIKPGYYGRSRLTRY